MRSNSLDGSALKCQDAVHAALMHRFAEIPTCPSFPPISRCRSPNAHGWTGRLRGYRDPVPLRPAGGRLATGDRGGGARRLRHQRPGGRHAYPREATEAFLNGHVSAFAFLVGVPRSVLYDTATLAVARIVGDGTRRCTRAFTHLQSYYPFRDRFGRPGKGNDKGKVEALVKTARRRFFVPIPKPRSIAPPIPSSRPRTGPVSERKHQHRGTGR